MGFEVRAMKDQVTHVERCPNTLVAQVRGIDTVIDWLNADDDSRDDLSEREIDAYGSSS